jgi:hypothetical protein
MANTTNLVDLQKYLGGATFPASKQDLIKQAKMKNAPGEVVSVLNGIADREYADVTDVSNALGGE